VKDGVECVEKDQADKRRKCDAKCYEAKSHENRSQNAGLKLVGEGIAYEQNHRACDGSTHPTPQFGAYGYELLMLVPFAELGKRVHVPPNESKLSHSRRQKRWSAPACAKASAGRRRASELPRRWNGLSRHSFGATGEEAGRRLAPALYEAA